MYLFLLVPSCEKEACCAWFMHAYPIIQCLFYWSDKGFVCVYHFYDQYALLSPYVLRCIVSPHSSVTSTLDQTDMALEIWCHCLEMLCWVIRLGPSFRLISNRQHLYSHVLFDRMHIKTVSAHEDGTLSCSDYTLLRDFYSTLWFLFDSTWYHLFNSPHTHCAI